MTLGERIFEERVRRKMSLLKFSTLFSVSYQLLWDIENNVRVTSKLTTRLVSDRLSELEKEPI